MPSNYRIQLNESGSPLLLKLDFDGDKKRDSFMVLEQAAGSDGRVLALLSARKTPLLSPSIALCCGSLTANKNVVVAVTRGMRGFSTFRFRWEAAARDFRLIGFDTESFGNASGDGSGKASLNLLNGAYEGTFYHWDEVCEELAPLPPVRKTLKLNRKVYLGQWSEDAEQWLYDKMNAQLAPELR